MPIAVEARRANGTRLDASLGITERIAPSMTSWTGDMRKRYTDFQVYEINRDGSVLHLTETRIPPAPKEPTPPPPAPEEEKKEVKEEPKEESKEESKDEEKKEEPKAEEKTEGAAVPEISPEDLAAISSLANEEFANQLLAMYQTISANKNAKPEPATSPVMDDKENRGQLHQHVRRIFRSMIDTTTDPTGAIVAKVLSPRSKGNGVRGGPNNNKQKKPKVKAPGDGEYLHFTLYKENRDTMDATHQIAKALRIKPQAIGTAGTKDRRATTTQRCSVRHQRADALARANSRLHGVTTGDYLYSKNPIHLGVHLGNEFVIALKDCVVAAEPNLPHEERHAKIAASVEAAMKSMHSNGWINYFGHQRFGTHSIGTHELGRLILQGDFEGAINAILNYDEAIAKRAASGEVPTEGHTRDDFNRHHACMIFREGGSMEDALKHLPRRFMAEASVIRHLGRPETTSRRDFVGALTSISRSLRSMYLHAYQSYIWNHAASYRWRLYGNKVVEGDLILATASRPAADEENAAPAAQDDHEASSEGARPLTAEEAASGRYTVDDIVLPSPGHAVAYPANAVGEFYTTFMRENGGLDPEAMVRRHREFSLTGAYRKFTLRFLAEPAFEVREYTDDNEQMHPTDMDLIRARRGGAGGDQASKKRGREEEQEDGAAKKAKHEDAAPQEAPSAAAAEVPAAPVEESKPDEKMEDAVAQTEDVAAVQPAPVTDAAAAAEKKTAVVVKFQLPKSAYATVALRELMGIDDSEGAAPVAAPAPVPAPAN